MTPPAFRVLPTLDEPSAFLEVGRRRQAPLPAVLRLPRTHPSAGYLELDCYEGSLRLAIEYQGKQHYEFVKQFHRSEKDAQDQLLQQN